MRGCCCEGDSNVWGGPGLLPALTHLRERAPSDGMGKGILVFILQFRGLKYVYSSQSAVQKHLWALEGTSACISSRIGLCLLQRSISVWILLQVKLLGNTRFIPLEQILSYFLCGFGVFFWWAEGSMMEYLGIEITGWMQSKFISSRMGWA